VIVIILLWTAVPLAFHCVKILLQSVPASLSLEKINDEMLAIKGVLKIHDLHIWCLSDDRVVASMHAVLPDPSFYTRCIPSLKDVMHKYGIHSTTIQPEFVSDKVSNVAESSSEAVTDPKCAFECPEDHSEFLCCPEDSLLKKRKKKSPKLSEEN